MEHNIFLQISALLGITVSIAFVVKWMRQPLIVAYIVAGIVSGPLFLNLLNGDSEMFDAFAQFGIVLLLFVLGLNLNFNHLKKIGKVSAITGIGQVLFTFIVGTLILFLIDFPATSALYLALAITFSSTIIIVKLLNDKRATEKTYGKYTIGLMLIQDIIAILVLIIFGTFNAGNDIYSSIILFLLKGVGIIIALFLVSNYVLPRILDKIAAHGEFLFIFTIAWCFGIASLVNVAGFSIEIGAVIAGLTLGSSRYQPGIVSRIKPLRDFFIVLFFIILGSEMGLANFGEIIVPGIILSLFILIGNPFILYLLFRFSKFTRKNSFLAGITAAQVSEFGFIVLFMGRQFGHVDDQTLSIFTLVALITIFSSSYLITYNERIYDKFLHPLFSRLKKDKHRQQDRASESYDAIIIGYHRIGWKICEALKEKNIKFAVIDYNPEAIGKLSSRRIPAFFGDISDLEFLESMPLEKAKLIISTIPDPDDQKCLITYVRTVNKGAVIIANLSQNLLLKDLYRAGADYVMMPHLLGGHWMSEIIKSKHWNKETFAELQKEQEAEMQLRCACSSH